MLRALFRFLAQLIAALFSRKVPDLPPLPQPVPTVPGPQVPPTVSGEPAWLSGARRDIGFHETGTNRGIEHYIAQAHCGSLGDPWCAIFVNAKLEQAGFRGTRSAMARSFENSPHFVKLNGPTLGAIVTMWRGSRSSGNGHVFIYTGTDAQGRVWGIGGNESDAVREAPHEPSRVVGYFWPKGFTTSNTGPVRVDGKGHVSTKEV